MFGLNATHVVVLGSAPGYFDRPITEVGDSAPEEEEDDDAELDPVRVVTGKVVSP